MYNEEWIGTYMDRIITTTEVPQKGSRTEEWQRPLEYDSDADKDLPDGGRSQETTGTGERNVRGSSQHLAAQLRVGGASTLARISQELGRTISRAKVVPQEPPHQKPPTLLKKRQGRQVKSVSSQTFKDKYLGRRLIIIDTGSSSNANNSGLAQESLADFIQETEFTV